MLVSVSDFNVITIVICRSQNNQIEIILTKEKKKEKKLFCYPLKGSLWENQVTSVSDAQILNKPWVWYSHSIAPMIKMLNQNMTQRGTQAITLSVMMGRCSKFTKYQMKS